MNIARLLALGLLCAAPAFVLYAAAGGRHEVSPGNKWSIDDASCEIAADWDGGVRLVIKPDPMFPGERDIEIYNPAFRKFVTGEMIFVEFRAADKAAGQDIYSVFGYRDGKSIYYSTSADDEMLESFATNNSFQFLRDDDKQLDLDMTGFAEALGAMRACEPKPIGDPEKM